MERRRERQKGREKNRGIRKERNNLQRLPLKRNVFALLFLETYKILGTETIILLMAGVPMFELRHLCILVT